MTTMATLGMREFESSFQERNPLDCALFLFETTLDGTGLKLVEHLKERGLQFHGNDIRAVTGFLYVHDPSAIAHELPSWVRSCRIAHDLSVLYVFASRFYRSDYDEVTGDLTSTMDLHLADVESGVLHALARQDLAIKVGATLLHPQSYDFPG